MKIWFAADIPPHAMGGVARSMNELAAGLRKRGHQVTIITCEQLPAPQYLLFALRFCLYYIIHFVNRPDWIIARSTDSVFCAILVALFKLRTKIILYNHGWEECVYSLEAKLPSSFLTSPTSWRAHLIRFPLLRLTLRLCTYCISGTEHEVSYLRKRYPAYAAKCTYISNGVHPRDPVYWNSSKECPLRFLTVGGDTWKKNLIHSLRIFLRIRKVFPLARLFIVGTGVDADRLKIPAELLRGGVSCIPSVRFDKMDKWYSSCPFMIVSSRYEGGHSLAMLEALSYGICVFASSIASNREVITDGKNGYLLSGTNASFDAGKMVQILKKPVDPELRARAANTAALYSWSRQTTHLERLLWRNPKDR